uniref:Uncharacterized protein n=1 Tax=Noctiluca scintillans TaxID=2966 RepID=A0A7S1AGM8_NOCSC|mmetsp:Transcript_45534/g.120836  ORF Transcript_45534/g.120836 Transcript_45534/m.120836 type:complete len:766 (+) Transcript_45534:66-2363(+)
MDARVSPELRALLDRRRRIIEGVAESISLTDRGSPVASPKALRRPARCRSGPVPALNPRKSASIGILDTPAGKAAKRYRRISAPAPKKYPDSVDGYKKMGVPPDDDIQLEAAEMDPHLVRLLSSEMAKGPLTERTSSTAADEASGDETDSSPEHDVDAMSTQSAPEQLSETMDSEKTRGVAFDDGRVGPGGGPVQHDHGTPKGWAHRAGRFDGAEHSPAVVLEDLSADCSWYRCGLVEIAKEVTTRQAVAAGQPTREQPRTHAANDGADRSSRNKAEMSLQLDALRKRQEMSLEQMNSKLVALQQKITQVRATDKVELETSRKEIADSAGTIEALKKRNAELQIENDSLKQRLVSPAVAHVSAHVLRDVQPESGAGSSESALRRHMADQHTTADQLKESILAVEALVQEARREMQSKRLRERRAIYEKLFAAVDRSDEDELARLIPEARRVEIEEQDVDKAEAKLLELRSFTTEQRLAKEMAKLKARLKEQAFVLVKRDNVLQLRDLLESADAALRWQEWKDYAGRTLWRCAIELRARAVQEYLAPILGLALPSEARKQGFASTTKPRPEAEEPSLTQHVDSVQPLSEVCQTEPESGVAALGEVPVSTDATPAVNSSAPPAQSSQVGNPPAGLLDEAELKPRAFRAVAQDNVEALETVLRGVSPDVWSFWQNKAGKDLLSLSEERGSGNAYRYLAKENGLLKELAQESYEEGEAVWIFLPGEVQPRRASVMEDTPEDAALILVEFWDDDDPPSHVERCLVRKMAS